MQITVFGASGKVGRLVVTRLLEEGHAVTAFVHHHAPFADQPQLTIVHGDIHSTDDIVQALQGSEAVISCLGSWHTSEKNILSSAMERLIPAMRTASIQRIITLTGAGAFAPQDTPSLFDKTAHAFFNTIAPKILRDAEEHLRLLSESGLAWTTIRSPIMTELGTHTYVLSDRFPLPQQTIHRRAVAECLVVQLKDASSVNKAPFIVRSR